MSRLFAAIKHLELGGHLKKQLSTKYFLSDVFLPHV